MQLFIVFVWFTLSRIYIIHSIHMIEILYIWYMCFYKLLSWNLFAFCYADLLSRPDRNQSVIALVGTPTR